MNRGFPADVAGLAAAVLLLVSAFASPPAVQEPPVLPESLGKLRLVRMLTGQEAAAIVDRMHGRAVAPRVTAVGFYASTLGRATVYHSVYRNAGYAARVCIGMQRRIGTGAFPFRDTTVLFGAGITVTRCVGLGMVHHFAANGPDLIWITSDSSVADLAPSNIRSLLR